MTELTDYQNIDDMIIAHRKMLKSLLEQNGVYRPSEAVEINNAFGKQINMIKVKLEAFKMIKEQPKRHELFLPPTSKNK